MKNVILTVVIIILVGTIGILAFLFWRDRNLANNVGQTIIDNSGIQDNNVSGNKEVVIAENKKKKDKNTENLFITFEDVKFGIRFQYPKYYIITKKQVIKHNFETEEILIYDTKENQDRNNPKYSVRKSKTIGYIPLAKNYESINGVKYLKEINEGSYAYIKKQPNGYYYFFEAAGSPTASETAQIFEDIMKSVKFIK